MENKLEITTKHLVEGKLKVEVAGKATVEVRLREGEVSQVSVRLVESSRDIGFSLSGLDVIHALAECIWAVLEKVKEMQSRGVIVQETGHWAVLRETSDELMYVTDNAANVLPPGARLSPIDLKLYLALLDCENEEKAL